MHYVLEQRLFSKIGVNYWTARFLVAIVVHNYILNLPRPKTQLHCILQDSLEYSKLEELG